MSTFEHIEHKADAWRKCWVCGSRVYSVKGKAASDKLAPINAWVEVDLSNGVIVSFPDAISVPYPNIIG
jgi:hypothetical protein